MPPSPFRIPAPILCLLLSACPEAPPPPRPTPERSEPPPPSEQDVRAFLDETEALLRKTWSRRERVKFVQMTYLTHDTEVLAAEAEAEAMDLVGKKAREARRFEGVEMGKELRRKLDLLRIAQTLPAPPSDKERQELAQIASFLEATYGKGRHCPEKAPDACKTLDQLGRVMAEKRDYNELLDAWKGWHAIARGMRERYARYVELANAGARDLGFSDLGALWRAGYDMSAEDFDREVHRLFEQVRPLYQSMHCYVRARLREKYGDKVPEAGPIPAHLLGNMWAQEWGNIFALVAPKGDAARLDLSARLRQKKTTPMQMVKYGEGFFTSLGLLPLPETFFERSMLVRPRDRDVMCHASAWDITFAGDLRLKMCIEITEDDFRTIHHELGHNYYYLYYKDQPILFQQGAHDGFHEAIGDTIALSITPEYLVRVGILDRVPPGGSDIPRLLKRALDTVAFLPFGMLIDEWRWQVFSGRIKPADYNKSWWELRMKYQGIMPPVERSEEDFDPGAKYHIPGNVPYIRYFLARILQYQLHRALCEKVGHKGPLDTCSIHGNKEAGALLGKLLAMGASRPWPEALETVTGTRQMDASALLDYYKPLAAWLDEQNKGKKCGW